MRELSAKNLVRLRKQAFEEFCWQLIVEEYKKCFEPDAVELRGPSPEDFGDGRRDLEATVLHAPTRRGFFSLLPNAPGRIFFSCKSHADDGPSTHREQPVRKDGWKRLVVRDIDPAKVFDGKKRLLREDAAERAVEGRKPALDLLSMLADGGSYWILINVAAARVSEFETDAARRLEYYIQDVLGRQVDLTGRIKVKDATFLAEAFKERRFTLSEDLCRQLDVDEPEFLWSWERWSVALSDDRRKLHFEVDDERQEIIDELGRVLHASNAASEPSQRVFRLAGAPGVGKTRLVHHILEQPEHAELHARARYTKYAEEARRWLDRGGLAQSPNVVLIVDEVPPDGANELWRAFLRGARSAGDARLILLGPRDDADVAKPEPALLGPFESEKHRRALVEHDLRQEEEEGRASAITETLVGVVTNLSEGYPLFSMWLTRALAKDPQLLDAPGSELTDGRDPWRATAAVLVGPPSEHGDGDEAWTEEAELRARALLLVILVPDDPWGIPEDQQTSLVHALEVASWAQLKRAARRCKDRGLLRDEPVGHHYISPVNLERLVLDHLFGGSPGPEPERLREASPKGFERLLRRVVHVKASAACRRRLAKNVLDELDRVVDRFDPQSSQSLELVALVDPEPTSFAVARLVARLGAERIASDDGLVGPVRGVLEHLRHRRISSPAFEAVEGSLFSLAVEKQEPWGNNARAIWASLFQAILHQTHRGFDERFGLLRRRLSSIDPNKRQVALEGLVRLIAGDSGGFHPGLDDVDGPWEQPTDREVLDRQRLGWSLLAQMAEDSDPGVSRRARGLIAEHFSTGFRRLGISDVLSGLPVQAGRWLPMERNALRDAVEWELERCNHGEQSSPADVFERLAELRSALRPTDLQERMLSQIGRGRPAQLSLATAVRLKQEQDDDRALARELLESPDVLVANLDWLTSEHAARSRVFGNALGSVDVERKLLPLLEAARRDHPVDALLVSYLCGWSDRAGSTALDSWLAEHADEPSMANIVVRTIIAIGGSDSRARILVELVARGGLEERSWLGLGFWAWHEGVSLPVLDALIGALARSSSPSCRIEALGLTARRLERTTDRLEPPLSEDARGLLRATSSDELSAVAERDWIAVAVGLYEWGDAVVMFTVLSTVVEQGGYLSHARRVLDQWLREYPIALWKVVVEGFSSLEEAPASILAAFANRLRLLERVPPGEVLGWIGDDARRAALVALWAAPYEDDLSPAIRGILALFGARSDAAEMLLASAVLHGGRGSSHEFEREQLERAIRWANDPEPGVAVWASRLRDRLAARVELRRERGYA